MNVCISAVIGFAADLILGDPEKISFLHPVVWMGSAIRLLEGILRRAFPKTQRGELIAGGILAFLIPAGTYFLSASVLGALRLLCRPAAMILSCIWCWQALAARNLRDEAHRVYDALHASTIEEARKAVSRIVGRDTATLDARGVIRAAVETVAENFSDGVIAPMFYMLIGGAPLALTYKAVNTLDSMVGYKNDRYLHFGRASAYLDDAANFIPSRVEALLLTASAALTGENAKLAFRIWRRDRLKHESPNSAQCEAAMAGALGVQLCGPAVYSGVLHNKPFVGDDLRPVSEGDILRACRMEAVGSFLGLAAFCAVRLMVMMIVF